MGMSKVEYVYYFAFQLQNLSLCCQHPSAVTEFEHFHHDSFLDETSLSHILVKLSLEKKHHPALTHSFNIFEHFHLTVCLGLAGWNHQPG